MNLQEEVAQRLGAIPHRALCIELRLAMGGKHECTCDREQRVAQAVTRAIQETRTETERQCADQGHRPVWNVVSQLIYDAALAELKKEAS